MGDKYVQLTEAALVEQEFQALTCGKSPFFVLTDDAFGATPQLGLLSKVS